MKPQVSAERRREHRVQARLQIEVEFEPGAPSQAGSTINISSNGVYFTSPRFVAPLTKLSLRLLLPDDGAGNGETAVECQGVVVRCLPERRQAAGQYEIACYFTDTSDEFQELLGQYVQTHL